MPPDELKEWVTLIKDALLGLAALVTIIIAIYGTRVWKRELAGKEIYTAAKNLVKESHILLRATSKARQPICDEERMIFSEEQEKHITKNEKWFITEEKAYLKRIDDLSLAIDSYKIALLEMRVLLGSNVYLNFLPFGREVTDVIRRISNYLILIKNNSSYLFPDSPEVLEAQQEFYQSENSDDDLSQKIADTREEGEKYLLSFLHRKSIRG